MYQIRTDLALETQEKMQEDKVELKGVRFSEEHVSKNLTISTVVIETENGAKAMEKPKGTYITIEALNMDEEDELSQRDLGTACQSVKAVDQRKKRGCLRTDRRAWKPGSNAGCIGTKSGG